MNSYPGRYPAIVREYSGATRTCRVEIPGITDGGDVLPSAEIEYPIGDRSKGSNQTEIEILAGDTVWVSFIAGDPRYPIITGWRNPSVGNSLEWRRFHHANFELTADGVFRINADKFEVNAKTSVVMKTPSITNDAAATHATGSVTIDKGLSYAGGLSGSGAGSMSGGLSVDGVSVTGHTHGGVKAGADNSAKPN